MIIYIATIMIFALAILGLSVGMIVKGKQIKGHCGGNPVPADKCIRDKYGNKIQNCSHCDCE